MSGQSLPARRPWFDVSFLIALLVLNAFFLNYNAFRTFNFYDMCFPLDGGWRIASGQRPYADFIYYTGPVHLYLNALFFKLFGFGKAAVLAHLIFIHSLVITAVFIVSRKYLPVWITALVTILTTTSFYWPISHPWHNQTALFFGIMAVVFFLIHFPLADSKAFLVGAFPGVCVVLAFITKTDIGIGWGLIFISVFLTSPYRSKLFCGHFVGLLMGGIVMLVLVRSPVDYWQQISDYSQMIAHDRLSRLLNVQSWLANYYWVPLLLVLINAYSFWKEEKELLTLLIALFVLSIFSIFSGDILICANIFLWGIFMAVCFIVMYRVKSSLKTRIQQYLWNFSTAGLVLATVIFIGISVKYGLELKVWTYSKKDPIGDYAIKASAFRGWRCEKKVGEALDNIVEFINTNVPKTESLLVVTDLQILNGLSNRDGYRGIPLGVFVKDHSPVPGRMRDQVRKRIQGDLPDWIVTDFVSYLNEIPDIGLGQAMKQRYNLAKEFGLYAIFKKVK